MLSLIDHPVRPSSEMDILDGSVSDSEVMKISGSQVRFRSTQSRLSMDPISAIERTDVKLKSPAERPTSSARPTACVAAGGTEEKSQLGKRKSSGKVVDPIVSPVLNTSHVQRRSSFSAAKRKSDGSIPGVSRSFSPEKKLTEISPTAGKKKDKKRLKRRGGANRSRETAKDRVDKNLSIPAVPLKKDAEPQSTSTTADQTNPKATKFRCDIITNLLKFIEFLFSLSSLGTATTADITAIACRNVPMILVSVISNLSGLRVKTCWTLAATLVK